MQMERKRLSENRQGKLRRALGVPLPGESSEQLDRVGEQDRRRAEQGLVPLMGEGGKIFYKHIDDLDRLDMNSGPQQSMSRWSGSRSGWSAESGAQRRLPYPHIYAELQRIL
jgi:hypothetical protein